MCVCVLALVTRHENASYLRCVMFICNLPESTVFFHIISQTARLPAKNVRVLILCTAFSEKFLILRRIQRDVIINVPRFSLKHPSLLSGFIETLSSSTDFRKIHKYKILRKSPPRVGAKLFHADGRHDECNTSFAQFCKHAKKKK